MGNMPMTRPSLLVRIRDARDGLAWSEFVEIYAPLVYGFACRHGLQDADAADLTQEVLRAVSTGIRTFDYDPQHGSFRAWLFTVVRNKLRNFLSRHRPPDQASGGSDVHNLLSELPAREADAAETWDRDYERQLFTWAAGQVRQDFQGTTWQAFWQTAVEGKTGQDVARELGMSVAAVYLAKGRVLVRLKEEIRRAVDESTDN
jgi:RNA polymerase sigma-70 factor (ECF subfamily)